MPKLLIALFLLGLVSCSPPKDFTGRNYRNNFEVDWLYKSRVRFISADSFLYTFSHDKIYGSTVGSYRIYENKLYMLSKEVKLDSVFNIRSRQLNFPILYDTVRSEIIPYQSFWFIGHNKLFFVNKQPEKR